MTDLCMFIWQMARMPAAQILVEICKQYSVKRVAIKVLEGAQKFNVADNNDKPLLEYMGVLRQAGIVVEGWGYHYPDKPGPQGDAIEERRQKLGFATYHVDIEGEWKQAYGMPAAIKLLLSKPKVNLFEMLICSYRFPSQHPLMPWDAAMNHETTNGASPQVYWAMKHNPVEQLIVTFSEYSQWEKPVFPLGAMFGAYFTLNGVKAWWEPTQDDIYQFMRWCRMHQVPRAYFWSFDYVISKSRWDWLEAANWTEEPPVPPDPDPDPEEIEVMGSFIVSSGYRNLRSKPNGDIIGQAQRGSQLAYTEEQGDWKRVEGWVWKSNNE